MADIYADSTLSADITDGSYSIANRDDSGSDGNAYADLMDAWAAASPGDTIWPRDGSVFGPYGQKDLTALKHIRCLPGENYQTLFTDGNHGFQVTSGANGAFLTLRVNSGGGTSTNKRGVFVNGAAVAGIHFDIEVENWGGATSNHAVQEVSVTGKNYYHRVLLKNSNALVITGISQVDVLAAFDVVNQAFVGTGAGCNCVVGQMTVLGGGNSANGVVQNTGGTTTIHNALIGGIGVGTNAATTYPVKNSSGTMTINAGVVQGNVLNPITYLVSGTVGGSFVQNGQIKFDNPGFGRGYACFYNVDSNNSFAVDGLDLYTAAFAAKGKKYSYFPDDNDNVASNATSEPQVLRLLAAGHELGAENSSSSPLSQSPLNVVSSATAPTLTVSADGNTLTYSTTEGTDDFVLDISKDTSVEFNSHSVAFFFSDAAGLGGYLNNVASLTATVNVDEVGTGNFDDAYTYCLASGTFDISSSTDLEFDPDRWYGEEIDQSIADLTSFDDATIRSFLMARYVYDANALPYLRAAGIEQAIGDTTASVTVGQVQSISAMSNVYGLSVSHKDPNTFMGSDWDSLTAGQKTARAQAVARVFATAAERWGLIFMLRLKDPSGGDGVAEAKSIAFAEDFIDECDVLGLNVMGLKQALDDVRARHSVHGESWDIPYTPNYAPLLAEDASALGTGVRWWTGAEPVGLDGEPFSDFDTDPGVCQSTHGAFHPVNL